MNKIAIFVMSCDKTSDIASLFIRSFGKYWPDCPFPVFIGTNTNTIDTYTVNAKFLKSNNKGWQQESIDQLNQFKQCYPDLTHLLVFLDDFLFSKFVNTNQVAPVLIDAVKSEISYLRCKRLEESAFCKILQHTYKFRLFGKQKCFRIREDHPYYSSLQVALWDIDHLRDLIQKSENIWNFEHKYNPDRPHYSVLKSLFNYKHIVEKGEWDFGAKEYCLNTIGYFNKENRPFRNNNLSLILKVNLQKITFSIFGYSILNIKRKIFRGGIN